MEYVAEDGAIAAHYEYSPFGETVIQSGNMADAFAFRFSTKYWEDQAKLYYYGYRFYVPESGRWLNRDILGERGDLNRYCMCQNTCMSLYDLKGLVPMGWGCDDGPSGGGVSNAPIPPNNPEDSLPPNAPDSSIDPTKPTCDSPIPDPMTGIYCSLRSCVEGCGGTFACEEKCEKFKKWFDNWYLDNDNSDWIGKLPDCPCDIGEGRKAGDNIGDTSWGGLTDNFHGYHKGASLCMRSKPVKGSGNQCCYDECGKLITHGSGSGSADYYPGAPLTFFGHLGADMEPADWAKFLDGGDWGCWSEAYLLKRPQKGSNKCARNP